MTAIPLHYRPFNSKLEGRFTRATSTHAPRCPSCGRCYGAVSTRALVVWYRRKCECAPKSLIKKLRPLKTR